MVPPLTVKSPSTKFVVASFDVNVKAIEESLLAAPLLTVELEIAIVGAALSTVTLPEPLVTCEPLLPSTSTTSTV